MNWQAISFDWNQTRAFLAVVELGSLSAAARALGQTQPTIGRQVAALEQELGVLLFERAGRSMRPTDAGRELAKEARRMAEAATAMSLLASGQSQSIEGRVRITASDMFSVHLLPPILAKLRALAPRIEIDLVATNDISDLVQREADIAIRHVRPDQPDLIARLVHEAKGHFYAAKAYLDRRARPQTLGDLLQHDFVSFGDKGQMMAYFKDYGIDLATTQFPVGSANGLVAWELVRAGFGIAPMSKDVGDGDPLIEQVLPQMEPITFPVWLVTHRELHTSKRIRMVFDLLAEELPRHMA